MGRGGGGQVVRVHALYFDNPRSNPADTYSFFPVKFAFEKNENKQKEVGIDPFFKKRKRQFLYCRLHSTPLFPFDNLVLSLFMTTFLVKLSLN